ELRVATVRKSGDRGGVVGLESTDDRIGQYGTGPGTGAYSCSRTGILTKNVEDATIVLQAVAGHDPEDPLSAGKPVANYRASIGRNIKNLRVGILRGYFEEDMAKEVKETFYEAIAVLQRLGMETEDVTIPHMDLT